MPSPIKTLTTALCPRCGQQMVESFRDNNPFPDEDGHRSTQTSVGCGRCGYQKVTDLSREFDPYNPNATATPVVFPREYFQMQPPTGPTMRTRQQYLNHIERIVRDVGADMLNFDTTVTVSDTRDIRGHEESTIDHFSRERMVAAIGRIWPSFEGTIRCELNPCDISRIEVKNHCPLVLIIDEVDGTTNLKRWVSSRHFRYRPQSLISCALCTGASLDTMICAAVYTLDSNNVISAIMAEGEFMTYCDGMRIDDANTTIKRGDSRDRIIVAGYSNSYRGAKGQLEQALWDRRLKTYEGCRASAMDVINILRNQFDAYVDLRHYCSTFDPELGEKEAMLQVYDIAGVLPIASGCGLIVTDAKGDAVGKYDINGSLPIVISRPDIHPTIICAIRPLVEQWEKGSPNRTIDMGAVLA